MTPDQALDYIRRNKELLNLSGIARAADLSPMTLSRHLTGKADARGYTRKIPIPKQLAIAEVVKKIKEG